MTVISTLLYLVLDGVMTSGVEHPPALGEGDRHRLAPARLDHHRLVLAHEDAGEQGTGDVPSHLKPCVIAVADATF